MRPAWAAALLVLSVAQTVSGAQWTLPLQRRSPHLAPPDLGSHAYWLGAGDALQDALAYVKKTGDKQCASLALLHLLGQAWCRERTCGCRYNSELLELAAIPSISSLPEHDADILKAADWCMKRLTAAGFEVSPGHLAHCCPISACDTRARAEHKAVESRC